MVSLDSLSPIGIAHVTESARVCPTGGGFEDTRWSVKVHDSFMSVGELLRRGAVGGVLARLGESDDPDEVGSQSWNERPPQFWFTRTITVEAPVGTLFRRMVRTPVRDRWRNWYRERHDEYELLREGLVSRRALDAKAERRMRERPAGPPLEASETAECIALVRATLKAS